MYVCPAEGFSDQCSWEIQRSRFITVIARVDSEDEARDTIELVRSQFPDARHHCHAFIIHTEGAQPREHSSDDGEPAGTAGRPMLDVLRGSGMENILAVVVRYFGGIKLGTGGLVKAYSHSVELGLELVPRVRRSIQTLLALDLAHSEAGKVEAELRGRGVSIAETTYGAHVTLTLASPEKEIEGLQALVASITQGEGELRGAGEEWVEHPLAEGEHR
ncbi:YigZ family protein [Corynebacterium uropygiale]|uniref:YigZ family protein n=1 Tax=Corynebacterium uropygiale TaxID=1775911 RepID=A0A9X1QNP5_9CORY|nr:YigZ family protein [Corynebacterium uropygiale]MCF4006311.1 YigZ family protein [Corynebacterium uropygiale]